MVKKLLAGLLAGLGVGLAVGVVLFQRPELPGHEQLRWAISQIREVVPVFSDETRQAVPLKSEVIENAPPEVAPDGDKHSSYTDEQVREAMREVLEKRLKEQAKGSEQARSVLEVEPVPASRPELEPKEKNIYRVELYSGAEIFAESISVGEDGVTYTDEHGLQVSIVASEVKSVKKLRMVTDTIEPARPKQ